MKTISAALTVAAVSVRGEVVRYWKTPALLAAAFAAGLGFAIPAISAYGTLTLPPLRGGDLGLTWRAGVRPPAATQQDAVDALTGLLLGAGVGTLAIAAVTILILSLAREAERTGEVAVRRAVGAGRGSLLSSALLEGGLIALTGIVAGGIAGGVVTVAMAAWPGTLRGGVFWPGMVGAGALAVVVFLGVTFPVFFARRRIGEAEPHAPAPLMPSAIQAGASLVMLTMGALLSRHASRVVAATSAAPADGAVYSISMPDTAPATRAHRYATLLRALAENHGQASLTSPGTLLGLGAVGTVTTDCGQCSEGGMQLRWRVKPATHRFVSADSFQLLGVTVVEGRGIASADSWDAPRVAVISRGLAAREFQFGQALGRGIRVVDDGNRWSTVVGVVDDAPAGGLGGAFQPRYSVYLSVLQHPPGAVDLLTGRRGGAEDSVRSVVRSALGYRALDASVTSVGALVAGQAAPLRWFAARFGLQGWAMLGIAALGSMAVTRLWVASLLGELGLRRALGARRSQAVAYVMLRAAAVSFAGLAGGVWFGGAVWSELADLVVGLDPWDVALVIRFGVILLLSTLLGALPPVWRATRATPASLLSAS
ncbi:MAG: ABC transporter permease [Gemmatimonadales bacterium]|nr:ABC transporter permease [Gemmatimonadales bacterium]